MDEPTASMSAAAVAAAAQRSERSRLREVASLPWVDTMSGDGWLAVRSGVDSNDLNGVLSEPGCRATPTEMAAVTRFFGDVPATWYVATPDPRLSACLVDAAWLPERQGRCAGARLPVTELEARAALGPGVAEVHGVRDAADIGAWLDVAFRCEWFAEDRDERAGRRRLVEGLSWPRWIAVADGEAVGMATGWRDDEVLEVVDIAVVEPWRRRGIATSLLSALLGWGIGARSVVAAPSFDGWSLLRTLGFVNAPTVADTAFYHAG